MPLRALAKPLLVATTILTAVLTVSACSSASTPSNETTTTSTPPPMATPLIGSVIAAPIPVPATDGRTHLAYELTLTNTLSGNTTVNALTARAGDKNLLSLSGDNLKYWTRALGNSGTPTNVIGPGQSAIVWLDVVLDNGATPPTEITHSVDLTVAKPLPGLVPANLTQTVAPVTVSTHKPASISPPLDGSNWLDGNSCCDMTAHRMAVNPINAALWVSERFAIDYVQLTNDFRLFNGDPTKLESYPYFGAPIHAVANGKVVAVVDNLPEQVPSKTPSGLPLDQYGGNHVVQDIGDGNFAFYAHLQPGSITVKVGDELTSGQGIAALGNSGNSDAPHLHFHVMDNPDPLAANGLPFVIKSFRLDQRVASLPGLDKLFTGQPAPMQAGFAVRDQSEVSPLVLDVMNYSVGQ
jgi:Peptidase family M23